MSAQLEQGLGTVLIDNEVIATYAGSVAVGCFGIVGMATVNMKDGLVHLLKKDYLSHGIDVRINKDNKIELDFHIIIVYGMSVLTITENLRQSVKYEVEKFTGLEIECINIFVEGTKVNE